MQFLKYKYIDIYQFYRFHDNYRKCTHTNTATLINEVYESLAIDRHLCGTVQKFKLSGMVQKRRRQRTCRNESVIAR